MNKVTVIIPNYNGKHFLAPCLDALKRQSTAGFGVLVIDNGSEDGSLEFMAEKYSDVPVISMGENTGFCKAINTGVAASDSEYVLLLNNDTIPYENFVEALVKAMDERPNAFSCSACMLTVSDHRILDGAGDLYNAFGWAIARGKGQRSEKYNKPVKIFSSCAGAGIYRRELFNELGMLDENHFAYLEDMDIGYRARIRGYENWYIPKAKVIHVGSGTSGSRYNEFKISHSSRNNVYMIYKNMPRFQRIINAPFHFIGFGIKKIYFKRKGFGELYKKGLKEGKKLALSQEGLKHRVPYSSKYLKNYIRIQLELWVNLFKRYG